MKIFARFLYRVIAGNLPFSSSLRYIQYVQYVYFVTVVRFRLIAHCSQFKYVV
jgi:hypothetical protein